YPQSSRNKARKTSCVISSARGTDPLICSANRYSAAWRRRYRPRNACSSPARIRSSRSSSLSAAWEVITLNYDSFEKAEKFHNEGRLSGSPDACATLSHRDNHFGTLRLVFPALLCLFSPDSDGVPK